ncbi:hypothetical protein [Actinomadura livida]|uniref:Uncharacterized protein n=1 Tax=Actinomadura livida TaxID=79909 RepID=A0A7W7IEX8_9ACTN|nr:MULTISPECIES: hypothetical protein [Actinomadura]MBB4775856.1 hypothetical protein [Actinomadura catellatispora]GGU35790.1 hypothetical protein GCM10010208_70490 [Actinomadura livida]
MTDKLRELHDAFVEWVYDHSDEAPAGAVDFPDFSETHGLDLHASFELLRQCTERGFVDRRHSTLGTPIANLTNYGQEWVDARRRRRVDKVQRMVAARNGLLRWLWEKKQDGVGYPVVDGFLKTSEARFEGELLTESEIDRAAASLVDRGLIHGAKSHGRRGPVRAETTDEGDRCVEQYSGDVMAYEQTKHKGGPTFNFTGDNKGNVSAGDCNTLNSTVFEADTAAKVLGVVEQYRQAKPTISLPAEAEAEVVQAMEKLEREVTSDSPDVGRIRRGLQLVATHLNTAAAGALGNLIAAGALDLAASLG